jgi:hypothetical protein
VTGSQLGKLALQLVAALLRELENRRVGLVAPRLASGGDLAVEILEERLLRRRLGRGMVLHGLLLTAGLSKPRRKGTLSIYSRG